MGVGELERQTEEEEEESSSSFFSFLMPSLSFERPMLFASLAFFCSRTAFGSRGYSRDMMHAGTQLTHRETQRGWRTPRCGEACSSTSTAKKTFAVFSRREVFVSKATFFDGKRKREKQKAMIRPARQACVGSSRPLPGVVAAAASCRRPIPRRRCRCSAEAPRAASDDADEAASTPTTTSPQSTSSSSSSSSSPPPDPEKRWRLTRLWGGHSSSYRVPGVSDWLARAPQVRVRQKRDRQVRN